MSDELNDGLFPDQHEVDEDGQQTGLVLHSLGIAVQVWSICNPETSTVAAAALTFRVSPAMIEAAVNDHYWMFIGDGGSIQHEGR